MVIDSWQFSQVSARLLQMENFSQFLIQRPARHRLLLQNLCAAFVAISPDFIASTELLFQAMVFIHEDRFGRATRLVNALTLLIFLCTFREEAIRVDTHLLFHMFLRLVIGSEISLLSQATPVYSSLLLLMRLACGDL